MKKYLIFGIIVLIAAIFFFNANNEETTAPTISPTPEIVDESGIKFDLDDQNMRAVWFKVNDIDSLEFKQNFNEKISSEILYEKNECKYLVNGGFYTLQYEPIGLLVIDGKNISEQVDNKTFNGYLVIDKKAEITRDKSIRSNKYALQTGPVLIEDGKSLALNLTRDKYARRMVAFLDSEENLYFAAIFNNSSYLQGPYLASTAKAIEEIGKNLNIRITDAINLDGGAASAFYTPDFRLKESVSIGSFFCVGY